MLDFVPVALKNLFSRPATRLYPKEVRKPFPGQRGHISIEIDNCIFCGICSRKCPVQAITVTRAERKWEIDRFRCIVCGACTEGCPKKCLHMSEAYTPPAGQKSHDAFIGQPAAPKPAAQPAARPAAPAPETAEAGGRA